MRNKFEERVAAAGIIPASCQYEAMKLPYARQHTYLPDWCDPIAKTIFEAKGRLCPVERGKLLAIRKSLPGWRIVIVLQYPNRTISKTSKTTYREWCMKNNFEVATVGSA